MIDECTSTTLSFGGREKEGKKNKSLYRNQPMHCARSLSHTRWVSTATRKCTSVLELPFVYHTNATEKRKKNTTRARRKTGAQYIILFIVCLYVLLGICGAWSTSAQPTYETCAYLSEEAFSLFKISPAARVYCYCATHGAIQVQVARP